MPCTAGSPPAPGPAVRAHALRTLSPAECFDLLEAGRHLPGRVANAVPFVRVQAIMCRVEATS